MEDGTDVERRVALPPARLLDLCYPSILRSINSRREKSCARFGDAAPPTSGRAEREGQRRRARLRIMRGCCNFRALFPFPFSPFFFLLLSLTSRSLTDAVDAHL